VLVGFASTMSAAEGKKEMGGDDACIAAEGKKEMGGDDACIGDSDDRLKADASLSRIRKNRESAKRSRDQAREHVNMLEQNVTVLVCV